MSINFSVPADGSCFFHAVLKHTLVAGPWLEVNGFPSKYYDTEGSLYMDMYKQAKSALERKKVVRRFQIYVMEHTHKYISDLLKHIKNRVAIGKFDAEFINKFIVSVTTRINFDTSNALNGLVKHHNVMISASFLEKCLTMYKKLIKEVKDSPDNCALLRRGLWADEPEILMVTELIDVHIFIKDVNQRQRYMIKNPENDLDLDPQLSLYLKLKDEHYNIDDTISLKSINVNRSQSIINGLQQVYKPMAQLKFVNELIRDPGLPITQKAYDLFVNRKLEIERQLSYSNSNSNYIYSNSNLTFNTPTRSFNSENTVNFPKRARNASRQKRNFALLNVALNAFNEEKSKKRKENTRNSNVNKNYNRVKNNNRVFFPKNAWPEYNAGSLRGWPGVVTSVQKNGILVQVDDEPDQHRLGKDQMKNYLIDGVVRVVPHINSTSFEIFEKGKKGRGVRARKSVPENTFVGVYPGRVMTPETHLRHVKKGLMNNTYVLSMFDITSYGKNKKLVDNDFVIDPSIGPVGIDPMFAEALAPRLNEPSGKSQPNCTFVFNVPKKRIEIWTASKIDKGKEATICYGLFYKRKWRSWCQTKWVDRRYIFNKKVKVSPVNQPYPIFDNKFKVVKWLDKYNANNNSRNTLSFRSWL